MATNPSPVARARCPHCGKTARVGYTHKAAGELCFGLERIPHKDAKDSSDSFQQQRGSQPPCLTCGEQCDSQWEFVSFGEPAFEFCSSCDPGVVE